MAYLRKTVCQSQEALPVGMDGGSLCRVTPVTAATGRHIDSEDNPISACRRWPDKKSMTTHHKRPNLVEMILTQLSQEDNVRRP